MLNLTEYPVTIVEVGDLCDYFYDGQDFIGATFGALAKINGQFVNGIIFGYDAEKGNDAEYTVHWFNNLSECLTYLKSNYKNLCYQ